MTVLTQSAKSESRLLTRRLTIHSVLTIKVRQRAQTSGQGQRPGGRHLTRYAPLTLRALRYNHGACMFSELRKSEWGLRDATKVRTYETQRMPE
jgi:hypothetical protein